MQLTVISANFWLLLIKEIEIVKIKEVKMIWDKLHVGLNKQGSEIISVECRNYKFYNKFMKRMYSSMSIRIK